MPNLILMFCIKSKAKLAVSMKLIPHYIWQSSMKVWVYAEWPSLAVHAQKQLIKYL